MPDHLADFPLPEYQPLQTQFPDEDILFAMEDSEQKDPEDEQQWQLYFDGAVNRRGQGVGTVLATPQGQLIPFARKLTFECTNNEVDMKRESWDWESHSSMRCGNYMCTAMQCW